MKRCNLCEEMKDLWKEQQSLAEFGKGFRFIYMSESKDTIPFMLHTKQSTPFTAMTNGYNTPYFRLEKIIVETCIAQLSLLQPVDLKGHPPLTEEHLYAFKKTSDFIFVKLCSFREIIPLSHELVDRPLPIIESKS
ncbi:CotY/CotZ family spore coat protein [Sporosarcina sp. SAFN-015]|uniref:CotY/CotZ family spore coat protein n=1 Tax=Sporosarcina sp. SAFN-015 TaxID=3387274 RepID=UPI003F7D2D3B